MLKMPDPKEREQLMRNLEQMDTGKIRTITRQAMVKHFTVDELEYLINMYRYVLRLLLLSFLFSYCVRQLRPKQKLHTLRRLVQRKEYADFKIFSLAFSFSYFSYLHFLPPSFPPSLNSTQTGKMVMSKIGAYSAEIGPQIQDVMKDIMESNVEFYQEQEKRALAGEFDEDKPEMIKLPPRHQKIKDGIYTGNSFANAREMTKDEV